MTHGNTSTRGFSVLLQDEDGATLTLAFHGTLDGAAVQDCDRCVARSLAGRATTVVFDLSDVEVADDDGLHSLVDARSRVEHAGKRVLLRAVSPPVCMTFEVAGLVPWFDVMEHPSPMTCLHCDETMQVALHECPRCGHDLVRN